MVKTSTKKVPAKKVVKTKKKETFTITTFTEHGARSLKRIYENAGYKFVKSEVTPDKVYLTFEDNGPVS